MSLVVEARHLQKRYGDFVAVDDVSFTVEEGEIFGILGPNGAGKTTSVECRQGLRRADRGDLRVLRYDPRHEAAHLRRMIGSQLQESALPDRLKVWAALKLFSPLGVSAPTVPRREGVRLRRLRIANVSPRMAEGHSGGPDPDRSGFERR